ncbi:MAG: TIGR01548 family HAD-type hydrolase [Prochlorococcaceae cyanobacterium MAG_34]|jgi:HAD superfamily phosphatase|nr:TIGR01548 family HAD-type hydrolase [Prochlorococcaceae cyanobacterium MAG_34]
MNVNALTDSAVGIVVFDIDGVIRDVTGSHFRAMSDTVESLTNGCYRPTQESIDILLAEGNWNNDYEASRELILRFHESQGVPREEVNLDMQLLVDLFEQRYWGDELLKKDGYVEGVIDGYIDEEFLLIKRGYFDRLTQAGVLWGFFTGATRHSAKYVLEDRLGLTVPALFAVEDGPGKPDPTGLLEVVRQLETLNKIERPLNVIFAGDTVADQKTIGRVKELDLSRNWIGVGILPPHVHQVSEQNKIYKDALLQAGASEILLSIQDFNLERIRFWLDNGRSM